MRPAEASGSLERKLDPLVIAGLGSSVIAGLGACALAARCVQEAGELGGARLGVLDPWMGRRYAT